MTNPTSIYSVVPSRLAVGECFAINVKVLGPVRKIECAGNWNDRKPALRGPFNLNVSRAIHYHDDCLPEWEGRLTVDAGAALSGPESIEFDGIRQGVFPGDTRPIRKVGGFALHSPGFHFIRLVDSQSGLEGWSNPIYVTEKEPDHRIFWGDPHWQTFFSDGIRCPEELYAFARDEAFLDFGAITDHMEAITERQWLYFQNVTNDYNQPGRFATLIGQEWTHHNPRTGAPGHRNLYFRGDGAPAIRSSDSDCDSLTKLWRTLDGLPPDTALAVPHHSANVIMGVDWEQGWNAKYEKAVEIHSVWGSSECHADDGNPLPILSNGGEMRGRHVRDALRKNYRLGFVGGGDIHDGRPGLPLHNDSYLRRTEQTSRPCGYTAVQVPALTREAVFDAIRDNRTYATTQSRIYLDTAFHCSNGKNYLEIMAASEDGIRDVMIILNGNDAETLRPDADNRILVRKNLPLHMQPGTFGYVRVMTEANNMAWSSPFWT